MTLFSQNKENQEKFVVIGISVDGNLNSEKSMIIKNSGIEIGDTISFLDDKIRTAISRLWTLNIFSDIQIQIENQVENQIYLLLKVKENPRLKQVVVFGEDEIDEDEVFKKISLKEKSALNHSEIRTFIREIKKMYDEKGFLSANINYEFKNFDSLNNCDLEITINEGNEIYIKEIEFEGNLKFSNEQLQNEFSEIHKSIWWKFWQSAKFDKKKYDEDKNLLNSFYKKNGYRDFQILNDTIDYVENNEAIILRLNLYEGSQYKIRNIFFEGNVIYSSNLLSDKLGFQKGDMFDEEKFEQNLRGNQDQTDIASLYLDNGYLTFNAESEFKTIANDSLDITIKIFERNQYVVGNVEILGNTKTYDYVIRRELYTLPKDKFNRALMIRSIRQLSQLNYFNPEKIKPDYQIIDDKTVNLVYELEEKSSDNVNASIGYSEAFGATGAVGFTINNFSIADPFGGGGGQILNFEWQFGEGSRFRTFSLNFTEPWLYNTPTTVGFSVFDTRQFYYFDLRQTGISARVGRRLKWPDDFFRGDWSVRFQQNNVINGSGLYIEGENKQLTLSQTISRNSTDNPIFPSFGSSVVISSEISGGKFLPGDVNFYKINFSTEKFIPIFNSNRFVFYSSTHFGFLEGLGTQPKIPPIEFFYMGGTGVGYFATTPLRGYDDRSIGPIEGNQVKGGKVFLKNTFEFRFSVSLNPMPIYLLAFADAGNVWSDKKNVDILNLKRSAGVGARLLINPIGMVGFDYGYGFDDGFPYNGKPEGWKFHFVFGRGF